MATRVFAGYRLFQDNGVVCSDGQIAFYEAGTTTPIAVYSDKELSASLGYQVSLGVLGVAPDIWVTDSKSIKAVITGTGCTADTIDYLTFAPSSVSGTNTADAALGNGVVNGAFETWTLASSFSNISGDGDGDPVADGWYFTQPTVASNAISRQSANAGQARYGLRFGRPAASTSTNQLRLWQMLQTSDAYRFRGQEVTLSFWATAGANFSGTALALRLATGTTAGEDGDLIASGGLAGHSNAVNTTQAVTTTPTRYEFTATLGANIQELGVQFAYTGVGTAGANDWVQIDDVQIEIADAATPFKHSPEPLEYLRAQLTTGGRNFLATTFTDPGADVLAGWDDSAGFIIGYTLPAAGITTSGTAIALANDLAALEGLGSTGFAVRSASDTWVQRTLADAAAGLTWTNGSGVSGNPTPVFANDLGALEGLSSTGIAVRTATDTWAQRTLTGPAAGISVSNGNGVSGNPTLSLANDLSALEGLSSTGFAVRTTTDTWAQRSVAAGDGIGVTNGDGVSGNPTVAVDSTVVRTTGTQSIAGAKTFTSTLTVASTAPLFYFDETDGAADQRLARWRATGGNLLLETRTDADGSGANILTITRGSGTAVASFGITPPLNVTALDTSGVLVSGTYTPTLTNGSNVAASTAYVCQYMRVGNVVTVSGKVDVDPTAASAFILNISIPVSSNFTDVGQLAGMAHSQLNAGAYQIIADAGNDNAVLSPGSAYVTSAANATWFFHFTYRVL